MAYRALLGSVLALGLGLGAAQAATVYAEDFTGQNGKGAIGPATDLSGVSWSLSLGAAALANSGDFVAVTNGQLTWQDTNGTSLSLADLATFQSPVQSVSGFSNLALSLDYFASGTFEVGGGIGSEDDFIVTVVEDGVPRQILDLVQANGTIADGSLNVPITATSTFQLLVSANNYAASEQFGLDSIELTGDAAAVVPLPAPVAMLGAGLLALVGRRRLRAA